MTDMPIVLTSELIDGHRWWRATRGIVSRIGETEAAALASLDKALKPHFRPEERAAMHVERRAVA